MFLQRLKKGSRISKIHTFTITVNALFQWTLRVDEKYAGTHNHRHTDTHTHTDTDTHTHTYTHNHTHTHIHTHTHTITHTHTHNHTHLSSIPFSFH
jgi:hypothetical protein